MLTKLYEQLEPSGLGVGLLLLALAWSEPDDSQATAGGDGKRSHQAVDFWRSSEGFRNATVAAPEFDLN